MMNTWTTRLFAAARCALLATLCVPGSFAHAQTNPPANTSQQLAFAGLRSVAAHGQINAVKTDSAGNLYLLIDQKDGVRLLKTDNAAQNILAQAQLGAAGDVGLALALDPAGNVYITGTSTSGALSGTSGAAIPTRTDTSVQSFVAKFDSSLNTLFVTFTGGSRIAAAALSATADAVFVTGITYASNLPVTANGIQQTPAYESTESGFVEKFSSSGSILLYATYLTGANGNTTPAAVVADAADNAYIVGSTSATGFPTVAAVVPAILSSPSGFLTKLDPGGDAIPFSTFIPGPGLTSIALDSTASSLLITGSVALNQFPVDTVTIPLVPTTYQVLLRMPLNGASVTSSTLLAPGTQSFVAASAGGGAWVDGTLTGFLLPLTPLATTGNGFAAHVNSTYAIDQTARFGGLPTTNPLYASLPALITSVAVDPADEPLVAGVIQPTASSSLLATETYDLPLYNAPTTAFPSTVATSEQTAATCTGSLCAGSAAYLAKLTPTSAPALSFSVNDVPYVILRNLGSAAATNLQLTATNNSVSSTCASALASGTECEILLTGGAAGTLTASASNAAAQSVAIPPYTAATSTIVFSPRELDFGIQTSTSPAATRTITVTNLGSTTQTFTSANAGFTTSPFTQSSSNCAVSGSASTKLLAAGATCHIVLAFTPFTSSSSDGFETGDWTLGARNVFLTAYSQAAALSASASEIDFGTEYSGGLHLPRYLYLSNSSSSSIAHTALTLPASSPFSLTDACPSTLLPASACRIRVDYVSATVPSNDSITLTLDQGLTVLLTGETLAATTATGSTVNPSLSVTPASITFATAVAVTSISSTTQTVSISNSGASAFPLTLTLTGDFTDVTSCGATLAAGATCAVALTFAPSQPGTRNGLLSVAAGTGTTPTYVTLTGTGSAILAVSNGSVPFGSVPVGQPSVQFFKIAQPFGSFTATTSGPYGVVLVEDVGYGFGNPASSAYTSTITGSCANCFLGIQFLPTAAANQPGTLTLATTTTGGTPYVLSLTGTGIPLTGLLLSPFTQDFGSVPVHSASGATLFSLTNLTPGGTAISISGPTVTGDFALVNTPSGGQTCTAGTLAYTASCFVSVAFSPAATGTRTGALTFTSGSLTSSAILTGTALADPGLALNPTSLTFSNVPGTSSTQQTVTLTNTGSSVLSVGAPSTFTAAFAAASACAALAPAASCTLTVTFVPQTATAADTLSIPVTSSSTGTAVTSTYTVPLTGAYTSANAGLQILPVEGVYGPTPDETQSLTRQFIVNNLTAKSLALNITIPRQYVLVGTPCAALAANASCTFSIAFLPLTNGSVPGTLYAQGTPSDGSATLTGIGYVEGFGTGHGSLAITGGLIVDNLYSFGQVTSGQTATQIFTVTNSASATAITVRRVTSQPPFLATSTCGTALALGQSCTVSVTYTPTNQVATGTSSPPSTPDTGTLTLESDSASSPDLLNLSGQAGAISSGNPANASALATFTLSQQSLVFASTSVGNASAAQSVTLTNTGTVPLQVSSASATSDFTVTNGCISVAPAATCTLTVTSTPQTSGTHIASLEISSSAATSLEFVSLLSSGTPSALTLSPSSLVFGSVIVGASSSLGVQVTNTSATPVTFAFISASGDFAAGGNCPSPGASLPAASSCTVTVTFSPTTTGARTGTLSLATSASTLPLTVPLSGTGIQSQLSISPASLAFGSIVLGVPASLTLTLANTGTAPITRLALTVSGDFAVSIPCAVSTLAPGASCSVQVTFTPSALGLRTATLIVTSSDSSSPASVPLTGTGIQTGSFTLTVDNLASATVAVTSGQPATYTLTVTPTGGFSGSVALTCAAVNAAPYASCSIQPGTLTLSGTPATSIATINTVTSVKSAALSSPVRPDHDPDLLPTFLCLLAPGIYAIWNARRRLRSRIPVLLSVILTAVTLLAIGCGGGGDPNLRYTPPGTYQYTVTASSTSGVQVSQTVALYLTVTPRN